MFWTKAQQLISELECKIDNNRVRTWHLATIVLVIESYCFFVFNSR